MPVLTGIGSPDGQVPDSFSLGDCLQCEYFDSCNTHFYSEDMWKKFELLPTPPLSPTHNSDSDNSDVETPELVKPFPSHDSSYLKAQLIQDCMWSVGHSIEELVSKPMKKLREESVNKTVKKSSDSTLQIRGRTVSVTILNEDDADLTNSMAISGVVGTPQKSDYSSSECVDPTHVFPYPYNTDHSYSCRSGSSSLGSSSPSSPASSERLRLPTGMQTPSDSGEYPYPYHNYMHH